MVIPDYILKLLSGHTKLYFKAYKRTVSLQQHLRIALYTLIVAYQLERAFTARIKRIMIQLNLELCPSDQAGRNLVIVAYTNKITIYYENLPMQCLLKTIMRVHVRTASARWF